LRAIRTGTEDARGLVEEPLAFLEPSKVRPPKAALDEIMESFR
jgi:hypothetical protein